MKRHQWTIANVPERPDWYLCMECGLIWHQSMVVLSPDAACEGEPKAKDTDRLAELESQNQHMRRALLKLGKRVAEEHADSMRRKLALMKRNRDIERILHRLHVAEAALLALTPRSKQ